MNYTKYFLLALTFLVATPSAWAWGGRGHSAICETATQLVKNKDLKNFLTFRPQLMGHLCNIPDIYWKSLGDKVTEKEGPSHWINTEVLGLKVQEVPLDYQKIMSDYTGKQNLFWKDEVLTSVPRKLGSLWWRADQFLRLAIGLKPNFTNVVLPKNIKEARNDELPYIQSVYKLMTYMGLLGHYVGDASMPYHSSADHDGWKAGHGGIHSYYEDYVVGQFPPDLDNRIYKKAKELEKNPKALKFLQGSSLEKMRNFSEISFNEVEKVNKVDPIIKKSHMENYEENKPSTPAERKPYEVGYKAFNSLIITEMARSSLLLAAFWDEIYEAIGKPNLAEYKSYKYPFTPDYIPPDYTELSKANKTP